MYVYTPVRNNARRATTLTLTRYPFSGQAPPRRSPLSLPWSCHHTIPTLTAIYIFCHRPPTSPIPLCRPHTESPSHPRKHSITASTIHNSYHYLPTSLSLCLYVLLPSLPEYSLLFLLLFPLPSSSNARSNPPGTTVLCHKYGNTGVVSQRECDNTKNFD